MFGPKIIEKAEAFLETHLERMAEIEKKLDKIWNIQRVLVQTLMDMKKGEKRGKRQKPGK